MQEIEEKTYAVVRWCVDDVIAAAEDQGITLTPEQAAKWWEENERGFSEYLITIGNEMLSSCNFWKERKDCQLPHA